MRLESAPALKRRKLTAIDSMDSEEIKAKLADAKQRFGHEIRVFETSTSTTTPNNATNSDEPEDFYEFSAEDYYRLLATKKEDKFLKTRKIREAEQAARRSRITKAVIRVRFPDNCSLESTFHPLETLQSLVDLLMKVVARPEQPFYIYTTPPKKLIKDLSQDFHSAGFVPGAVVYFSYDLLKCDNAAAASGPFLREEVMSLKGLELVPEQVEPEEPSPEPVAANRQSPSVQDRKPAEKKAMKPKWLKM